MPIPNPQPRTVEVDENFLPYPATKLIITQYLTADPDEPRWAWIIVGAFLDAGDNVLWSTEVFTGHLDVELESESDSETETIGSVVEEVASSIQEPVPQLTFPRRRRPYAILLSASTSRFSDGPEPRLPYRARGTHALTPELPIHSEAFSSSLSSATPSISPEWIPYSHNPSQPQVQSQEGWRLWDPSSHTSTSGYWVAAFDHSLGRWVHTWQPGR